MAAMASPSSGADPDGEHRAVRAGMDPKLLAYLMGPAALAIILALMHFRVVAREPVWLWVAIFVAVPLSSVTLDHLYRVHPDPLRMHARVAVQAAGVTTVIYLSGWGPVLVGAFAFLALENVAQDGAHVWRVTALWSLLGIACGQIAIWQGVAPSFLDHAQANALALMSVFILVFVIRMAGATMEEKEQAEATMRLSEDRFRSLIQNSSDATLVISTMGVCTYASPAVEQLLGITPEMLVGRQPTDLVHPDDVDLVRKRLGDNLDNAPGTILVQFRMARSDGTWCDVEAVVANQKDRPSVAGYVAHVRDITERKEFEALLAHRAVHDPLTGLANRQLILDRTEQMLARSRRSGEPTAAYFVDLDNFKDTNDSLGHEAGDRLLQAVAGRFVAMLRANDTVGRLGGDEFVILAEGISLAAGPDVVAERIRDTLREPFQIEGYEGLPITVTASVGIATGQRISAQELLRDADIALYRAKAAGKDCSVLFEPAMQSAAVDRLALKSDLDSAVANGQFFVLYQPIFDLDTVQICGVEALIRWDHPTRGVISPDDFIPVLEDSGMIVEVGRWVLREACAQAGTWHAQGHRISMSVNISMRQLESACLVGDVVSALDESGLEPGALTLEVTESTLMRDAESTVQRLRKLKELGVMIAIDDFGTGYSSLAYLRQFPVDVLKIDRSFVSAMDGSADSTALIHTLVELGRILGLVTLAEGIEDSSQLDGLRAQLCDRGQGFLVSRPVPAVGIEVLLGEPGRATAATRVGTALR